MSTTETTPLRSSMTRTGWGMAALIVGLFIGLQLPDADRVFTLFLRHRSLVTHTFLIPLACALYAWRRDSWKELGVAGLSLGMMVHLAFDLFPRRWSGYALINAPLVGTLDATSSLLWIFSGVLGCAILAALLLRTRQNAIIALVLTVVAYAITATQEEQKVVPLVAIILAGLITTLLPNPLVDGQAAVRGLLQRVDRWKGHF